MALCCHGIGDIFGQVNQDRTRTPFGRDEISFGHHAGNVGGVADNIAMLDHRQGHAENINLLERIGSHQVRRDLACDENNRNRVHISIGYRRDKVRCAGARGG